MRRLTQNAKAVSGLAVLSVIALLAILAPVVSPFDPNQQDLFSRLESPSWGGEGASAHLLGTDSLGRDILSRLVHGARVSLTVSVVAVLVSGAIGTTLGLVAGFAQGWVDALLMRIVDMQLALPMILFAITWVAFVGAGVISVIVVIAVWGWVQYARFTRSMVLSIRETQYIEASQALGARPAHVMFRHAAPNLLGPIIVLATLQLGEAVLLESALSFLGVGISPPTPSWGGMIAGARSYIDIAWWTAFFPGLAITLLVLAANLTGDAMRDWLDPTLG